MPVSKAETGEIVPVIIKYKYPPTTEHIEYIESLGQVKYVYDIIPAIGGFIYDYDIDDVESLDDVEEVELGQTVHTMLAQSRVIINADQVQALGVDGNGVRICIVDTGVDDSHPDLNPLVAEIDFVNNDNDATDDRGHGTHVAGIATGNGDGLSGAPPSGVAKFANIIAIQVFSWIGGCGVCSFTSDQIDALEHVLSLKDNYDISSVNFSLGGGGYLTEAACDADNPSRKFAVDNLRAPRCGSCPTGRRSSDP